MFVFYKVWGVGLYLSTKPQIKHLSRSLQIKRCKHLISSAWLEYRIWRHIHQYSAQKHYLCVFWCALTWWRASCCYQSEILRLYCVWNDTAWRQGSQRSGPAATSLSELGGGGGASAPARWPPGTSRALCLTERQAFVNPAGDGLWFIHSFSRISLSSCVLLQ